MELVDRERAADHVVRLELDAQVLEREDFTLDDLLGQAELRNAVDENSAELVQGLEDPHPMAALYEVAGAGEPRGTAADDQDASG